MIRNPPMECELVYLTVTQYQDQKPTIDKSRARMKARTEGAEEPKRRQP